MLIIPRCVQPETIVKPLFFKLKIRALLSLINGSDLSSVTVNSVVNHPAQKSAFLGISQ